MEFTKLEVASRQLDTAIKLFFNASDVVSVHTLAAASATVFADILDKSGEKSWRKQIIEDHQNELTKAQVLNILRDAQNFFKHAKSDPEGVLEFNETVNDYVIWVATLEAGLLGLKQKGNDRKKLSTPISVFQFWYMATKPDEFKMPENISAAKNEMFPGLNKLPRFAQLERGATVLKEREAEKRMEPED